LVISGAASRNGAARNVQARRGPVAGGAPAGSRELTLRAMLGGLESGRSIVTAPCLAARAGSGEQRPDRDDRDHQPQQSDACGRLRTR
jgi:hypothetical protein